MRERQAYIYIHVYLSKQRSTLISRVSFADRITNLVDFAGTLSENVSAKGSISPSRAILSSLRSL